MEISRSGSCCLRIAAEEDRTVNLRHIMDFGQGSFEIKILNTNQIVYNMSELTDIAVDFV